MGPARCNAGFNGLERYSASEGAAQMTTAQSMTSGTTLGRDVLNAGRYYLGNRWALLALASLPVIIIGLSFGGWGWLVAIGAAPIILSTLPCLIMCGLGVCMMCRSNKSQSAASQDAAGAIAEMDQPSFGGSSCCQGSAIEAPAPQPKQVQSLD
jgi:hypothetical protein